MAKTTWVLLADEGRARILERRDARDDLQDVQELQHPAAQAPITELRRDSMGRRAGGGAAGGRAAPSGAQPSGNATASAGEDLLEQEAERFAREVAAHLAQAQRDGRFEELCIAAAPKFLGRLRQQLTPQVKACVVQELDKNLLQLDRRTLTQRLFAQP